MIDKMVRTGVPRPHRILIVGDKARQSMVTSMVLEKAGYEVECVEALHALLVGMERVHPDLLIIDITTSELISEEWVARMREQYHLPETPIVLVVDRHSQRDHDVLQTGADELLVRPFDPPELLAAVEKRINRLVKQPKQLPDQPMDLRQYDAVTGLLHRDAFLARLQQLLDTARSAPGQGGVLFLELDNPRRIHDKLTISGTDRLLREIGALIASQVGPDDVLARFGDYAFALAVCTRQPKELLAFAEQLRQGVEEHLFYLDGPALTVTLSIGASFFDGRVIDAQRLVLLSEKACWIAAETSGNCVHAHKEIAEASGDDQDVGGLMGMLQEALATDGFQLFFQPIVSLNSKRGGPLHQVLLRMGARQDEFQQAQDFIPVAEQLGIMADLDRWVVERTLRYLKDGDFGSPPAPQFLIALSQASLETPDLANWLEQKLGQYGVSGRHLNFALRFADVEAELNIVQRQVYLLRKLGARITLTDFGEAPGAFNYLRRILVDYLRMPMGWMDGDGCDLGELVRKAHERHKSIIVPGVEAPRHMDLVWGSGADFVQGYFIQRPQARPDFDFSSLVLG